MERDVAAACRLTRRSCGRELLKQNIPRCTRPELAVVIDNKGEIKSSSLCDS